MMTTSGAARGVSIEAIQRVPLFADLNKHEIQEIARLFKEHRFAKGEIIVQEGSTGDTLFLIESGEAGVFIGGRTSCLFKSAKSGTRWMASIGTPFVAREVVIIHVLDFCAGCWPRSVIHDQCSAK